MRGILAVVAVDRVEVYNQPTPGCVTPVTSTGTSDDRAVLRGAESVLAHSHPVRDLPAETARRSTITQIYEGTNQIQRMVMARQLLKG
jgi:hypothetical protein